MFKKWILKAIVQKTVSFLPWGHKLNYLMQKYVTKGVALTDAYINDKLDQAAYHISSWKKFADSPLHGQATLELGTGWYPVVPISMYLCGADRIHTVDISPLMTRHRLMATVHKMLEYHDRGLLIKYFSPRPERMEWLREIADSMENKTFGGILSSLNIRYLVQDARKLNLPDDSIDYVHSNNTFEHVYPRLLADILQEFVRVLRPGGLMCHHIDMSDHFAHLDKTITIYNFLRYSDRQWRWIDNSIQPQNRLRLSDYLKLYHRLGIPVTNAAVRPGSLHDLRKVPLAKKYQEYLEEDLMVSHCHLVSRLKGA